MPEAIEPILADEFLSPAIRAQLGAFLILAQAVRNHLPDLHAACEGEHSADWTTVISRFAALVVQPTQIPSITRVDQANLIWNQFSNLPEISELGPRGREVIARIGKTLALSVKSPDMGLRYLSRANAEAVDWLVKFAGQHVPRARKLKPAQVTIFFDPKAEQACACSEPLTGRVGWGLQFAPHSFYGALVPERVFEHEYFSHLLPRNTSLSMLIHEVVLVAPLAEEHRQLEVAQKTDQGSRAHSTRVLYEAHRFELEKHFDASGFDFAERHNYELLMLRMSLLNPVTTWRMVSHIVDLEEGEDRSELAAAVFDNLLRLSNEALKTLVSQEDEGLEDVWQASSSLLP